MLADIGLLTSPISGGGSKPTLQFLTFHLGEEVFALGIAAVREIIQFASITTVPLMPNFVRGVINLRGAVVPVIDLQARFGGPSTVLCKKTSVVICETVRDGERSELGLMVDAVREVVDIMPDAIELPAPFGTPIQRDFIQGMVKLGDQFVVILALEQTLDIEDMARNIESNLAR